MKTQRQNATKKALYKALPVPDEPIRALINAPIRAPINAPINAPKKALKNAVKA
jgi:hypothetical protein